MKNKGQILLVDNESSEISAAEDTVFLHDGQDEKMSMKNMMNITVRVNHS